MQNRNPGIWIGASVAIAVLVVALSVPRSPQKPTAPVPATKPQTVAENQPPPPSRPVEEAETSSPKRPVGVAVPDTVPPVRVAPVAGNLTTTTAPPTPAPDQRPITRDKAIHAIDNVQFALRDFRSALKENPVGNNAEITKALLGDNLKQAKMDVPAGSKVSPDGELLDPWGTPYFFHQMGGDKMEVRSAGPDRVMWTKDDVQM